jgi:hypothetical protein
MEFTIVQEGRTPLTATEMARLVDVVDNFFAGAVGIVEPCRFDHLIDEIVTHSGRPGWKSICSRSPTALEIMAACCTLERRGIIMTKFVGGVLHFVERSCG